MKSITSLFSKYKTGRIYIFLADDFVGNRFMENAEKEGFVFGDGIKPTERNYANIIAINRDMTINYVGFVGRVAFQFADKIGDQQLIKIDYRELL